MKAKSVMGTPWFVRLAVYVVVALVGLILTVMGLTQPDQVDSMLASTGSIAALVGGLLAAANTKRSSDNVVVELPGDDRQLLHEQIQLDAEKLSDASRRAREALSSTLVEIDRVKGGKPIFSVFHDM